MTLMQALDDSALAARLAQLPTIPGNVVRHVPSERLQDFYEMAAIGMEAVTAERVTFDAAGQLMTRTPLGAACPIDGNQAAAVAALGANLLTPAAAAGATGFLLQDADGACLYVHEAEYDTLLLCRKTFNQNEDCHCF
ncbi:hypothetical protein [Lacticaseibacillus daqingensis]|uniref:hypothetical protein n=1 Tax=Lacticaseibacillus daqingensis TaxID=2486014 RepID=UPI000F7AD2F6|nr:hypothetical protein [Lacticaseibacillus daqingensis]